MFGATKNGGSGSADFGSLNTVRYTDTRTKAEVLRIRSQSRIPLDRSVDVVFIMS